MKSGLPPHVILLATLAASGVELPPRRQPPTPKEIANDEVARLAMREQRRQRKAAAAAKREPK